MNGQPHSDFLPIVILMFVSGLGIPIFAAFNGALGQQLGGPIAASAISFAIALVFAILLLALAGFPPRAAFTFERPYIWFGALFVLFYGIAVSFAVPRVGVGNAVFFVLLGQLVAAAAIDHFGWWGAMHAPLTLRRLAGILVMGLGVYLAKKPV